MPFCLVNYIRNLLIWNSSLEAGISVPYPCVSLHATQRLSGGEQALLLHIDYSDGVSNDDEAAAPVQIHIIPASDEIETLYSAVTACSNLHPDPVLDQYGQEMIMDEETYAIQQGASDGGLPPPFPGSGGWITAENVDQFFDADGNFIGGERKDGEEENEDGKRPRVNGHSEENGDDTDNKRPRI